MENSNFFQKIIFVLYSAVIGIIAAAIAWGFLSFYHIVYEFMWHTLPHSHILPEAINKYFPVFFGLLGGILIGLIHKKFGKIPKGMPEIEQEFYETGQLKRPNLFILVIASTLPLMFGASVDPEVAIISLTVAVTLLIVNNVSILNNDAEEFTSLGVGTALTAMFKSPLFGYSIAEKGELYKLRKNKLKSFLFLIAISSGIATFSVLSSIYDKGVFSVSFPSPTDGVIDTWEYAYLVLFAILGISLGYVFSLLEKVFHKIFHLVHKDMLITILVGLVIGIVAMFEVNAIVDGHAQSLLATGAGKHEIAHSLYHHGHWMEFSNWNHALTLGLVKIGLTALCLAGFWKGGEIFPLMFAGALIGLYLSHSTGVDPSASIAVVMGALVSFVTKKPIAIFMLFIFFFPVETFMPLMVVLIIANIIPKPHFLDSH